jgi:site-specific DNA-adenine methylase
MKLKAPLSYQGGKTKIAPKIVDYILTQKNYDAFVDVCCGSGAVSIEMFNREFPAENIYMFDGGPIGAFWQMVSEGSFDMDEFSDLINKIPKNKTEIKKYLESLSKINFIYVGEVIYEYLILQAGSFGGKQIWDENGIFRNTSFRDYWMPTKTSNRKSPVNPMMPMPETLLTSIKNIVENMSCIRATHTLVENINFEFIAKQHQNVCIYIDPPYAGTARYGLSLDIDFTIKRARKYGDVYVSEYKPYSDEYLILNKTNKGGITGNSKKIMTEYLSKINNLRDESKSPFGASFRCKSST